MNDKSAQIKELKRLWYARNPQHDNNADTGEDMFWQTVLCVFEDLNQTSIVCEDCIHFEVCNKQHNTRQTCKLYKTK